MNVLDASSSDGGVESDELGVGMTTKLGPREGSTQSSSENLASLCCFGSTVHLDHVFLHGDFDFGGIFISALSVGDRWGQDHVVFTGLLADGGDPLGFLGAVWQRLLDGILG